MSLAESVSKPSAFLTRLTVLLRKMPVVQFVLARLASLRGSTVARGEASEPALLGGPRGFDCGSLDRSPAAPPLIDLADADPPAADMTVADLAVVEQAVDDLLLDDLPLAGLPGGDQTAADGVAVLADPLVVEQVIDELPVDDPPLLNPVAVDALVADLMPADPAVVQQAVEELLADHLPLAVPAVVDQLDAHAPAAHMTAADPPGAEPAVDDLLDEDLQLSDSPVVEPDFDASSRGTIVADLPVLASAADDRMAAEPSMVDPGADLHLLSDEVCAQREAAPELDERAEREQLIRRRWIETGIKMWNLDFNGAGRATLNIQGRAGLLPIPPGETMARYDTLQFRQLEQGIVCEGVVVEAPRRRK